MKTRIILSIVVVAMLLVGLNVYDAVRGPIEGKAAVGQLVDSDAVYAASRAVATGLVKTMMTIGAFVLIGIIWLTTLGRYGKISAKIIVIASLAGFAAVGCGDYKKEIVREIGENQTAFVVPLEGDTKGGQKKFMSIEYLNAPEVKVATKRITIPTRKLHTGRMWWEYKWIETVKLIVVDRTPVTRVWTSGKETGTSATNQAFCVESRESVDFCAGATAMATIPEADAALYLYHYAGKEFLNSPLN